MVNRWVVFFYGGKLRWSGPVSCRHKLLVGPPAHESTAPEGFSSQVCRRSFFGVLEFPHKEQTMKFVGIDLHKKTTSICVVNQEREILDRKRF